jgi:excinuclease ABC subunit A
MKDHRPQEIRIRGARVHNLKNISLSIPRDRLVCITGLSGSGKSSLAFDTLYAEGQRRYVESLSSYARQFLEQMSKPDVDSIEGLSPAISIEQKSVSHNPRSTVGTVTEVYDYLRLLYARLGEPHCPSCHKPISSQTIQEIVDQILARPHQTRFSLLAPMVRGRKGEHLKLFEDLRRQGFTRVYVDGGILELENPIPLEPKKKHNIDVVVDRLTLKPEIRNRLTDSVETAARLAEGLVKILTPEGEETIYSERHACIHCGISLPELTPRLFSFNSPQGACPECDGLGMIRVFDPERLVPDPSLSIATGAFAPWGIRASGFMWQMLLSLSRHYRFDVHTPFNQLPEFIQQLLLHGSGDEEISFSIEGAGMRHAFRRPFEGVIPNLERRYRETDSDMIRAEIDQYVSLQPCKKCHGKRLRQEALSVTIGGKSIAEFTELCVTDALVFLDALKLGSRRVSVADRILKEIRARLRFMLNVGLGYLTLDRRSASLSGGEGQRIRLASQIGSALVGVLYVLDEPTIGLHPRDCGKLISTLKDLRDRGNTVVVVEHDPATILSSDHVIDMGPGAGRHGGEVVAFGTPKAIQRHSQSLTGAYLAGRKEIPVPSTRRKSRGLLGLRGARGNNLKNIDVELPLGVFCCVTGVSGSGKSTLVIDTLYRALAQKIHKAHDSPAPCRSFVNIEAIDKVLHIDQSPIGRTPRSNPVTYTGVFSAIRELFSKLPESAARGYGPGRYSFNVRGGRCETCEGGGQIRIEMHFLPDMFVLCEACQGKRFNRETLEIGYRGKNIAQILDLTVAEALSFFEHHTSIRRRLQTLFDVGLGYIQLGQSATTLSGGEAQRVKLSRELSRRSTGKTLYILDEPTTGLHMDDTRQLIEVLNRLVDQGNTVVVIEHNLDVIKQADWIIDLGPEGGDEGGKIVATGTPEDLAALRHCHTGQYLRHILHKPKKTKRIDPS